MASKDKGLLNIRFVFFWLLLAVAFSLSAVILVLTAAGYHLDVNKRTIEKTALIAFKTTPKDAVVYIDGKALDKKTPIRLAGIFPDRYDLKIEKAGHASWQKSLVIEGGLAYDFDKIVLFLSEPVIDVLENPPVGGIAAPVPDADLIIDGGEITYKNKLVTRLSQKIDNAIVYPDKNHIVFQIKDEIRVIELDGGNNILLVKLEHPERTLFGFQDEDTLFYQDGSLVKRARIL